MGTHPIFESDFDCLTEMEASTSFFVCNHTVKATSYAEMKENRRTLCQICGSMAKGVYYTATSCKSCMDFFRRCVIFNKKYKCIGIAAKHACVSAVDCHLCRRRCRFCRFQECYRAGMRNELVLCRQRRHENESPPATVPATALRETTVMNPGEHSTMDSIVLFWKAYLHGFIDPLDEHVAEGPLIEWRIHLTRTWTHQMMQKPSLADCSGWTIDTKIGKALHIGRSFSMHVATLGILFDHIPEMNRLKSVTKMALLNGSWLCLKILRSIPSCERNGSDAKTTFKYKGLSGKAASYTVDFFLAAGMRLSTLIKVMKWTGEMRLLQPDNEELALISAIILFTPNRRQITDYDDIAYIDVIQRTMLSLLEKKLNRNPVRITRLKDFLLGIAELRTLVEEHMEEYNRFICFTKPKIVCRDVVRVLA